MKRALSGDKLHIHSLCTLKRGSPLVARQGAVMREIRAMIPHNIPKIYCVGGTWYLMQTIEASLGPNTGYRKWNWLRAAEAMESYWIMPESWFYSEEQSPFDPLALYDYVEEQGFIDAIEMPSLPYLKLQYSDIPRLTHGDLTNENTVIERHTASYKLIDWQAQRHPYLPGHRDVDYGKLLQSLLGWDPAFGRSEEDEIEVPKLVRRSRMAPFWCAVHFMRIKKRAKDDLLKELCDDNIDYCAWLLSRGDKI